MSSKQLFAPSFQISASIQSSRLEEGKKQSFIPGLPGLPGENGYTVFVVMVKYNSEAWTVSRRFSQFHVVREELKKSMSMPSLPAKTWLRSFTPEFVEKRKGELDVWLSELSSRQVVCNSKHFLQFLGVDENVRAEKLETGHVPHLLKTVEDKQFGVVSMIYREQDGVLVTGCEDVHAMSRFDTKLSNVKMPWDQEVVQIPLGSLNIWRLNATNAWVRVRTIYFDCAVTALAYDEDRRYLMAGLNKGTIVFYHCEPGFKQLTLLSELNVHTARVTGLLYNQKRDILLSCSRDKCVNLYDMKKETSSTSTPTAAWLSSLDYDEAEHRLFVGSYNQTALLFDLKSDPPQVLHTLVGHKGSVRCVHFHRPERYLFTGGFDHQTGVWTINSQEEVTRSRSVGWLNGGPPKKVKSVLYISQLRIVLTGHDDGYLCMWDTAGLLLYVMRPHRYAVTALHWLDPSRVLLSGSQDGTCKFWQFPMSSGDGSLSESLSLEAIALGMDGLVDVKVDS